VPLGYSSTIVGDFSQLTGRTVLTAMNVYVEDKLTNISHDLKSGPYTFATQKGLSTIVLTYRNKVTLGTDDFETIKSR
jgi:hypothetical protein